MSVTDDVNSQLVNKAATMIMIVYLSENKK